MKKILILLSLLIASSAYAQQVQAPSGVNFGNGNLFIKTFGYGAPSSICKGVTEYTQLDAASGVNKWECVSGVMIHQSGGSGSSVVNSGTSGQVAYYAANGTTISGQTPPWLNLSGGTLTGGLNSSYSGTNSFSGSLNALGHGAFGSLSSVDDPFNDIVTYFDSTPSPSVISIHESFTTAIGGNGLAVVTYYAPTVTSTNTGSAITALAKVNFDASGGYSSTSFGNAFTTGAINISNTVKLNTLMGGLDNTTNAGNADVANMQGNEVYNMNLGSGHVGSWVGYASTYMNMGTGATDLAVNFHAQDNGSTTPPVNVIASWTDPNGPGSGGSAWDHYSVGDQPSFAFGPQYFYSGVNTGAVNSTDLVVAQLATPAAPIGTTSTSGGTVTAGSHCARVVAFEGMNATGNHSAPGPETCVSTIGSTSSITWAVVMVNGAQSYQFWLGTTGAENNQFTITGYTGVNPKVTLTIPQEFSLVYLYTAQVQTQNTYTAGTLPSVNNSGNATVAGSLTVIGGCTGCGGSSSYPGVTSDGLTPGGIIVDGNIHSQTASFGSGGAPTKINVTGMTVAALQALTGNTVGDQREVTDAANSGDCIIGLGAVTHWCQWTGSSWSSTSPILPSFPLNVPNGGSGLVSLTAHAIQIGAGTSTPIQLTPSSTVGMPVVSAGTGADPNYGVLSTAALPALTNTSGSSLTQTANAQTFYCTTTCSITPLTPPVAGTSIQLCARNMPGVSTVITLAGISGLYYEKTDHSGWASSSNHTMTSTGAVTDMICIESTDATHYAIITQNGFTTN
jgi:hypothetical protein